MALIFALVGFAWLLYYYLPGNNYTYFWGFFAMAVILLLLGALAGLLAARAVKKGSPPMPNMAIDEAQEDQADRQQRRRRRRSRYGGRRLMAQRSPAEIRNSIESNRMELAVSIDRLRGEVAHITDWRGHVERHREQTDRGRCDRRARAGREDPPRSPPATARTLAPRLSSTANAARRRWRLERSRAALCTGR